VWSFDELVNGLPFLILITITKPKSKSGTANRSIGTNQDDD
jgi:hypothetical protein